MYMQTLHPAASPDITFLSRISTMSRKPIRLPIMSRFFVRNYIPHTGNIVPPLA